MVSHFAMTSVLELRGLIAFEDTLNLGVSSTYPRWVSHPRVRAFHKSVSYVVMFNPCDIFQRQTQPLLPSSLMDQNFLRRLKCSTIKTLGVRPLKRLRICSSYYSPLKWFPQTQYIPLDGVTMVLIGIRVPFL